MGVGGGGKSSPKAFYFPYLRQLHYSPKPQGAEHTGVLLPCLLSPGELSDTWHTPLHMSHPLADDETRVILSLLQEEGHGDYINANFIRVRLVTREEVPLGGGEGGLQNLVNERAFPRAQMEARPTSRHKDPCLTLCWTSGAWFGSLGSRSALRDRGAWF